MRTKHNWVFIDSKHDDGVTELIFICSNPGCYKRSSIGTGSGHIGHTLNFGMKILNKRETSWDDCKSGETG